MVSHSQRVESCRADFKNKVLSVLDELAPDYTQRSMAGELVVSDATISRHLSPTSDFNLEAYALGVLNPKFSLPVLTYLAQQHGSTVSRRIPIVGQLNGNLLDELTGMVSGCGKLADAVRQQKLSPIQCRKVLHHIVEEATKAEAELDAMEAQHD